MHVAYALLADTATSGGRGKLNIIGTFNRIWAPDFPSVHGRMALVVRLEGHVTEAGEHTLEIQYVNQDGQEIAGGPPQIPFRLNKENRLPGAPLSQQVMMEINNLPLPEAGVYEFAIKVDGTYLDSIPLYVQQLEAGNAPGS